ncbi:MAG: TadE/TadG family type IV pilus assembly protein [Paracoccaceae bacterium]
MTTKSLRTFLAAEDGVATVFNLFVFMMMAILLGLSIDVANAYKARTQMQIAADTASHAALYARATNTSANAITKAVNVATYNMGNDKEGTGAIKVSDVEFGTWNDQTRVFTVSATSKSAVRVTAIRNTARGNGVSTYLLEFIGLKDWDVKTTSVATTYRPACLREGFTAKGIVDIQSNNGFYNGFCLHSNTYISINQNNYFEAGTIVSMPNTDNLQLPASGFTKNVGLAAALREAFYQVRIVSRIQPIITSLLAGETTYRPDYITSGTVINISGKTVSPSDFTLGRVHKLMCNSGNKVTLNNGTYKSVVIIASCPVTFSNGVILEDVVFGNSSTDSKSYSSPSGLQIGKDDHCVAGGGAQLLTLGGASFASKMQTYGGQIIAVGDVSFAAQADGIEGTSIVSGGRIDGTSNMTMGLCNAGMEDNFELDYYRVVM